MSDDVIAVCIVTMRRPTELTRLLAALAHQRPIAGKKLLFLVVDNDDAGSAWVPVAENGPHLPGEFRYVAEPEPGVSQARNRALSEAAGARWIAFIDDDETPALDWLAQLHKEIVATGAVAVSGPVKPLFHRHVPAWLAATFELCYVRQKLGRPASELQTSNVILDAEFLRREDLRFDDALGAYGGEDTDLCVRILSRGGLVAWCETAVVYEHVAPNRAKLLWLLRRWIRLGGTEAMLDQKATTTLRGRLRSLYRGTIRIVGGALLFVANIPALAWGDAEPAVRRLYTVMRGIGMILAACNYVRRDYGDAADHAA